MALAVLRVAQGLEERSVDTFPRLRIVVDWRGRFLGIGPVRGEQPGGQFALQQQPPLMGDLQHVVFACCAEKPLLHKLTDPVENR